ncbi:MAG: hypothetical protein VB934_01870 [Polyangiaceae bacterium]
MRRTRAPVRSHILSFLCALSCLALSFGTTSCDDPSPSSATVSTSSATVSSKEVKAPKGLMMVATARNAQATWQKLLAAFGARTKGWSPRVGGMVARSGVLPLTALTDLREESAAVAVVARLSDQGPPTGVLALSLSSGRNLIMRLTRGATASWRTRDKGAVRFLEARDPIDGDLAMTRAVIADALVLAPDEATLLALGPYAAQRTYVSRAKKEDGAIEIVFADDWGSSIGPFIASLDSATALAALGGGVGSRLRSWLAQTRGGRARIGFEPRAIAIDLSMPARDSAVLRDWAKRPVVKLDTLNELPGDSAVVASWGETAEEGQALGQSRGKALARFFRIAVPSKAHRQLDRALSQIAKGSGPTQQLGLRCSGVGLTAYVRGDVRDAGALESGWIAVTKRLLREPRARSYLRERELVLSSRKSRIETVLGTVWRLRLMPRPEARARREPIDLLFHVTPRRYLIAAGMQPTATLQQLDSPDEKASYDVAGFPLASSLPTSPWLLAHFDGDSFAACRDGSPAGRTRQSLALVLGQQHKSLAVKLRMDAALLSKWFAHLM